MSNNGTEKTEKGAGRTENRELKTKTGNGEWKIERREIDCL
jgi:hypothetical protein